MERGQSVEFAGRGNSNMNAGSDERFGILLTDDLFFESKVVGTAEALGLQVLSCPSVDQVLAQFARAGCRVLLVDLTVANLDWQPLMDGLPEPRPMVIGFGPHVDKPSFQRAREAGCHEVLPRSQIVQQLPMLLQRLLGG